jgi:tRNA A-37 threonylcarbamoyl transferase component Bud32
MNNEPIAIDTLEALNALLDARHPVRAILWQGRPAFGKRRSRPRAHERALLMVAPLIRRWLGRDLPFTPASYEEDRPVEVQRLSALRADGCHVPAVLDAGREVFVLEDAGEPLYALLVAQPDPAVRLAWLQEAARDLAAFHTAGHWHGGAQLRNLVRARDGGLVRIDFETRLDTYFPVPLLQAFDAALFFSSLARTPDSEALRIVARSWRDHAPEAAREALRRSFPLIRGLAGSWLVRRLAPKEAERLQLLASLPLG